MRGLAGPPGSSSGEAGEDDEEASSSEEGSGEAGAAADEVRLDLMSGRTADGLRDAGLGMWYASMLRNNRTAAALCASGLVNLLVGEGAQLRPLHCKGARLSADCLLSSKKLLYAVDEQSA